MGSSDLSAAVTCTPFAWGFSVTCPPWCISDPTILLINYFIGRLSLFKLSSCLLFFLLLPLIALTFIFYYELHPIFGFITKRVGRWYHICFYCQCSFYRISQIRGIYNWSYHKHPYNDCPHIDKQLKKYPSRNLQYCYDYKATNKTHVG